MRYRTAAGDMELLGCKAHQVARLGIARTFQNLELFAELTVFDNVLIARSMAMRATLVEALLGLPRQRREEREGVSASRPCWRSSTCKPMPMRWYATCPTARKEAGGTGPRHGVGAAPTDVCWMSPLRA